VRAIFAGGGTGGHLYPAIAIADALAAQGASVTFVGTAGRLEATLVPKAGYALRTIRSRPLPRRRWADLLGTVAANLAGTLASLRLVTELRPDIVIATGGYVCFPVVLAAWFLRLARVHRAPIVLFEPNARAGVTNRTLAPMADEVWGAFPDGDACFGRKYVPTGVPVRASLRCLPSREQAVARLGLDPSRKTLLALGGSQGARTINDALVTLIEQDALPPGWQLLQITGEREFDRVRAALERGRESLRPYLHDLSDAYAAADLVLARAGASTLGELAALGLPAILVPYPHAADDHQTENARRFERAGAAVTISDRDVAGGQLPAVLARSAAPERLAALRAGAQALRGGDAVETILARVEALLARKKRRT
jgi:UDP-N-acetylglucosamine--N-acetylmuramyl-(pentapeptide) pyrophosphoryl-undecaprenol N-acetylglucosamine transferase